MQPDRIGPGRAGPDSYFIVGASVASALRASYWLRFKTQDLQRRDGQGGALLDICSSGTSVLRDTLKFYTTLVTKPIVDTKLDTVFWYFEGRWANLPDAEAAAERARMVDCTRSWAIGLAAQLWWRCILPVEGWPFKLLDLGRPHMGHAQKLRVAQALLDTPDCCLDPGMSRKVTLGNKLYKPNWSRKQLII